MQLSAQDVTNFGFVALKVHFNKYSCKNSTVE
jgi:hypothetical protein